MSRVRWLLHWCLRRLNYGRIRINVWSLLEIQLDILVRLELVSLSLVSVQKLIFLFLETGSNVSTIFS